MAKIRSADIRLRNPLSDVTRAERRTLLAVSAVGIVIVKTGLIPTKVSALGVDFTQTDQRSLLWAIAAIVFYFLLAFLIYAASDFLAWRIDYREALEELESERKRQGQDVEDKASASQAEEKTPNPRYSWLNMTVPVSFIRAFFEFLVPAIVGIYAIMLLMRARV